GRKCSSCHDWYVTTASLDPESLDETHPSVAPMGKCPNKGSNAISQSKWSLQNPIPHQAFINILLISQVHLSINFPSRNLDVQVLHLPHKNTPPCLNFIQQKHTSPTLPKRTPIRFCPHNFISDFPTRYNHHNSRPYIRTLTTLHLQHGTPIQARR